MKNNEDKIRTLYYWFLVEQMKMCIRQNRIYARWIDDGNVGSRHDTQILQNFSFLGPLMLKCVVDRIVNEY